MDFLVKTFKTHVQLVRVLKEGEEIGLSGAEVRKILRFYAEVGAIIFLEVMTRDEANSLS